MQTLARYPNTGWLRTDVAGSTSIVDAALTQGSGYFTGARAVIRTTNWSYDTARVSAHTGTTLTRARATAWARSNGVISSATN